MSSDTNIATVDANGMVTGVAAGSATVTVTTTGGGWTDTCAVTVAFAVASQSDWNAVLAAISNTAGGSSGNPKIFDMYITDDFSAAGKTSGSSITGDYKEVRLTGTKTISLSSIGSLIRTAANQTFVIDGPTLQGVGNNSYSLVYINSGSAVKLCGGAVKDNTCNSYGGGVYVSSGTFTMEGGTVSGNTAKGFGGGVYAIGTGATVTMKSGTISGNTAKYGGGGVFVSSGTFTMKGGTISGNAADLGKKGVEGTYTKNGGTIQTD
jgi:hypothetical protein